MIDGSLTIPYGEIPIEERQRMQQTEILKNQLAQEIFLMNREGKLDEVGGVALRSAATYQMVEQLDQGDQA